MLAPATILGHNLLARLPWFGGRPPLRDRICVGRVSLGGVGMAMGGTSLMRRHATIDGCYWIDQFHRHRQVRHGGGEPSFTNRRLTDGVIDVRR